MSQFKYVFFNNIFHYMKIKKLNSVVSMSDIDNPLELSKAKFVNLIKKRKIKIVIN